MNLLSLPGRAAAAPRKVLVRLALVCAALPGCGEQGGGEPAVGTFPYVRVHRSFLRHEGAVTVRPAGLATSIRGLCPSRNAERGSSGQRTCLAADEDFELRIRLEAPPPNAEFETAFAIPEEALEGRRGVTATLEVRLDGATVARRRIDYDEVESRTWHAQTVDLSPLAGRAAELTLVARVDGGDADARIARGWADPRVKVRDEQPWVEASADRPNVVVVLVDTLRARNLGCYGYDRDTSPRLDAFAADALVFEDVVAPAPWTWPSTASVFTGQYPLHHGVVDGTRNTLPLSKVTLAELCAAAGMNTAAFIGNPIVSSSRQFDQGFVMFVERRWRGGPDMLGAFGEWLEGVKRGRFFAYLHFFEPHAPYEPPEAFVRMFSNPRDPARVPERVMAKLRGGVNRGVVPIDERIRARVGNARDRYDAEIRFWDRQFGHLLELLETHGVAEETIVVVTADHGEEFLEHDLLGHGLALYDTLMHVPLIIRGPGIAPGRVAEQVELISLAPTVAEAAGIDASAATFDGISLLDRDAVRRREFAFLHTAHAPTDQPKVSCDVFAIRTPRWKLHFEPLRDRIELYDRHGDAEEEVDLALDADPAVVAGLRRRLERWIETYRALEKLEQGGWSEDDLDEETRRELEELGYLGGG